MNLAKGRYRESHRHPAGSGRSRPQPKIALVVNPAGSPGSIFGDRQSQQYQQGRPYDFSSDRSYRYLDVDLSPYARDLTARFVAWVILTALLEAGLLSWPIVATVIWGTWAAMTWMSFGYAVRILALVISVIEVGSRVHKIAGRPVTRRRRPHGYISLTLGAAFVPSPSLMAWYVLALAQTIFTILTMLLTLVAAPAFTSRSKGLLLGLTIGFQALSILQSLAWPGIFYTFAVRNQVRQAVFAARHATQHPRRAAASQRRGRPLQNPY